MRINQRAAYKLNELESFLKKIFIALIICCLATTQIHAGEPFIWADDQDYEPFMYKTKNQEIKGVFRDIIVEIFSRIDIPLKYDVYPWKRTQAMVKSGQADAMITVPTQKRLTFLSPTDPIVNSQISIFVRKDNPRIKEIMAIKSVKGLEGFKIVDYLGDGWAEKNFKGLEVYWAPGGYTAAILILARKGADVFVDDNIAIKYRIKTLLQDKSNPSAGLKAIVASKHIFHTIPFCLLIRKDSKYLDIIPEFNKKLAEIKQDGTYDRILDQYIK